MRIRRFCTACAAAACAVAALAGCKSASTPGPATTVTVTAQAPAAHSSTVRPSPTPSTSSHSTAPPPMAMSKLPGPCDDVLALASVDDTIDTAIKGPTAFVVGLPDSTTGRVTYINCRYGVSGQSRELEIQVSLYRTAAQAAARIPPTIADFGSHGATPSKTTVAGIPATALQGGTGEGYGPSVILAYGQRTVAVTLQPGTVPTAEVGTDLIALAALAVKRTSAR